MLYNNLLRITATPRAAPPASLGASPRLLRRIRLSRRIRAATGARILRNGRILRAKGVKGRLVAGRLGKALLGRVGSAASRDSVFNLLRGTPRLNAPVRRTVLGVVANAVLPLQVSSLLI